MDIAADFPGPYWAGGSGKHSGKDFLADKRGPNHSLYGRALHDFKYCFTCNLCLAAFWDRVLGIGFHSDFDWGAFFKLHLIAFFVLQGIFDANFSV